MTLNDTNLDNDVLIACLKSETMDKLINRIQGSHLLISSLPGSALRTPVKSLSKPRDVNKRSQSLVTLSDQFKKIIKRYFKVGYNLDVMRQSACLVLNPITVYSYDFLFNSMTVRQNSDSMTGLT